MQDRHLKWAPVLFCFAITLSFSLTYYYRAPYHDHWDIVPLFAQHQEGNLSLADLFALHGNHWHASGYAVLLGLADVTAMRHWAESLASVLFAGLGFVALARILNRSLEHWQVPHAALWLFGVAALLLFSLDQAGNWLWGWQVAVFINIAGTLWTIERLSAGPPTLARTSVAVFATGAAIYAFGTGWVLLPIGYGLLLQQSAWRTRTGQISLFVWTLLSALLLWHFSLALNASTAAYSVRALPNLSDPMTWAGLLHYTLNFVASPIVRFARDSSVPVSLIGLVLIAWSVWTLRRVDKKHVWSGAAPFLAMAAYSLGSGLLTALGRLEMFGVKQAFVSRYITFGSLFWMAVFGLTILAIIRTRPRKYRGVIALLGLLFVLKLGNIPSVVQKSVKLSNLIEAEVNLLVASPGDPLPKDYQSLHQPAHDISDQILILKDHRASLYAELDAEPD
ncbi:MAG: hypothetical protein AAF331_08495 [Pseudomonadota bacterium]